MQNCVYAVLKVEKDVPGREVASLRSVSDIRDVRLT